MCAVRLRIRIARPRARGCQRFIVTPSSANASATTSDSSFEAVVVDGVGDRRLEHAQDVVGRVPGGEAQLDARVGDRQAADVLQHDAGLAGRRAHPLRVGADESGLFVGSTHA